MGRQRRSAAGTESASRPATAGRRRWPHGAIERLAPEGTGGREPATEEASGQCDTGRGAAEGSAGKKPTPLAARQESALGRMAAHGFWQRQTCRLIEVDPKTVRRQAGGRDAGAVGASARPDRALVARLRGRRAVIGPAYWGPGGAHDFTLETLALVSILRSAASVWCAELAGVAGMEQPTQRRVTPRRAGQANTERPCRELTRRPGRQPRPAGDDRLRQRHRTSTAASATSA